MARPARHTEEAVLEVARAVFVEHGPHAPLGLVAERLGLSAPALFKRFGSKEALLCAALGCPGAMPFVDALELGPDARALDVQLVEHLRSFLTYARQLVPRIAALRAAGIDPHEAFRAHGPPPLQRQRQALSAWLRRGIEAGRVRPLDADALAISLNGAMHGRAFLEHVGLARDDGSDAFVEAVVDAAWHGLRPPGEPCAP